MSQGRERSQQEDGERQTSLKNLERYFVMKRFAFAFVACTSLALMVEANPGRGSAGRPGTASPSPSFGPKVGQVGSGSVRPSPAIGHSPVKTVPSVPPTSSKTVPSTRTVPSTTTVPSTKTVPGGTPTSSRTLPARTQPNGPGTRQTAPTGSLGRTTLPGKVGKVIPGTVTKLPDLTKLSQPGRGGMSPIQRPTFTYARNHGVRFGNGYIYRGLGHRHWTHCCYWGPCRAWCYWCPSCCCWYYWHATHVCFYPVTYIHTIPPVAVANPPVTNIPTVSDPGTQQPAEQPQVPGFDDPQEPPQSAFTPGSDIPQETPDPGEPQVTEPANEDEIRRAEEALRAAAERLSRLQEAKRKND